MENCQKKNLSYFPCLDIIKKTYISVLKVFQNDERFLTHDSESVREVLQEENVEDKRKAPAEKVIMLRKLFVSKEEETERRDYLTDKEICIQR